MYYASFNICMCRLGSRLLLVRVVSVHYLDFGVAFIHYLFWSGVHSLFGMRGCQIVNDFQSVIVVRALLKRPNPLGLKCDTITSPRRLVNTFIHQMILDLLKRDKPIKVAINFKSWSTTRDISSEWG
jgi:hypothetical protein